MMIVGNIDAGLSSTPAPRSALLQVVWVDFAIVRLAVGSVPEKAATVTLTPTVEHNEQFQLQPRNPCP